MGNHVQVLPPQPTRWGLDRQMILLIEDPTLPLMDSWFAIYIALLTTFFASYWVFGCVGRLVGAWVPVAGVVPGQAQDDL